MSLSSMSFHKSNILFLDCGLSGHGGSFRSLKEHIFIMRAQFNKVIVVLVNDSLFENDYRELDCQVLKLKHPLYSKNSKWLPIYNKGFGLLRRISLRMAYHFHYFFEYFFSNKIIETIKAEHIDCLHLNNQPMRNFSGFIAAAKTQCSVISHIRTLHTFGFSHFFLNEVKKCKPCFISISQAVQQMWSKFGLTSTVIFNPILMSDPVEIEKKFDFIYVGRLEPDKGVEDLIRTLSDFPFKARLAILGEGSCKKNLIQLVDLLLLSNQVFFLGYVDDVAYEIQSARILVMPSKNEGMGRVLIEAMKLKVPVIANQIGGMIELIEHGVTGLLYDADHKNSLKEAMLCLIKNNTLYSSLKETAYHFAVTHFSQENYIQEMKKYYHDD